MDVGEDFDSSRVYAVGCCGVAAEIYHEKVVKTGICRASWRTRHVDKRRGRDYIDCVHKSTGRAVRWLKR